MFSSEEMVRIKIDSIKNQQQTANPGYFILPLDIILKME